MSKPKPPDPQKKTPPPSEPLKEELDKEANAQAAEEMEESVENEDAAVDVDAESGRVP